MNKNLGKSFESCNMEAFHLEQKGWGGATYNNTKCVGEIFVHHGEKPFEAKTVKLLCFDKDSHCSLHFHVKKTEYFVCTRGRFAINLLADGQSEHVILEQFDSLFIEPGMIHEIIGLDDENILLEVSTLDAPEDSYRIKKGD